MLETLFEAINKCLTIQNQIKSKAAEIRQQGKCNSVTIIPGSRCGNSCGQLTSWRRKYQGGGLGSIFCKRDQTGMWRCWHIQRQKDKLYCCLSTGFLDVVERSVVGCCLACSLRLDSSQASQGSRTVGKLARLGTWKGWSHTKQTIQHLQQAPTALLPANSPHIQKLGMWDSFITMPF